MGPSNKYIDSNMIFIAIEQSSPINGGQTE
jgi:hypothetical protein